MKSKKNNKALFSGAVISGLVLYVFLLILLLFVSANQLYNYFYSRSLILNYPESKSSKACSLSRKNKDTIRILIVDGGGIDGLMPLVVLHYLEQKSGKPTSALFDFFIGTSTGSIIISSLNTPDKFGKPKFSANQIIDAYISLSKVVMLSSVPRKIFTLDGILGPKFSIQPLYNEFVKQLGEDILFHDLMNDVAILSYEISNSKLYVFKNWDCFQPEMYFPVPDLLVAATATPAFYSSVIFKDVKNNTSRTFVDGAVSANNPSLYALKEAFIRYPNAKKYIIVHLGTGSHRGKNLNHSDTAKWGLLQWIFPILSIVYEYRGEEIRDAMLNIKQLSPKNKFEDFYFNDINAPSDPFDTSEKHIRSVEASANLLITQQKKQLDYLAKILPGRSIE